MKPKVKPRFREKDLDAILQKMVENWPSEIVARTSIKAFSGGLLNPRTMANLDSLGQGPDGVVKCGRKSGYIVRELVSWMRKRMQVA